MPYIKKSDRERISEGDAPGNAGELNYVITKTINAYLGRKGLSYSNLNEIIGVLECAKLELYRRVVSNYEDSKIAANGDVYSA